MVSVIDIVVDYFLSRAALQILSRVIADGSVWHDRVRRGSRSSSSNDWGEFAGGMPLYGDHVYPHFVRSALGNPGQSPEPIRKIPQELIPLAPAEVPAIGVGPGLTFPL